MGVLIGGLSLLGGAILVMYAFTLWRTRTWDPENAKAALKGLALPAGSIRGLIAFVIIGAFVIFAFFGDDALLTVRTTEEPGEDGEWIAKERVTEFDRDLYNTLLAAFGTLTGAVTGFYFGSRGAQKEAEKEKDETRQRPTGAGGPAYPGQTGDPTDTTMGSP